jgi:hypothetical protein
MIEAVENHNPEVIVIDEIGREREAEAARTINERGVQLIGTAHGNTLENLLLNPTLSDLVGGIESVTLSDEEARRRGTQKTVLERRAPPTFDVLIEIQDRQRVLVHRDVTTAVDSMLRGEPTEVEIRYRNKDGGIGSDRQTVTVTSPSITGRRTMSRGGARNGRNPRETRMVTPGPLRDERPYRGDAGVSEGHAGPLREVETERIITPGPLASASAGNGGAGTNGNGARVIKVFPYGVARNRLYQAAKQLGVRVVIVETVDEANVLVTLKSYFRKRRRMISDAESSGVSVYVLRANTVSQMERFLIEALGLEVAPSDPFESAVAEAQRAIALVQSGETSVDLNPVGAAIRRYQHQLVRQANLVSHSYGREPYRHVRVFNAARNIQ